MSDRDLILEIAGDIVECQITAMNLSKSDKKNVSPHILLECWLDYLEEKLSSKLDFPKNKV